MAADGDAKGCTTFALRAGECSTREPARFIVRVVVNSVDIIHNPKKTLCVDSDHATHDHRTQNVARQAHAGCRGQMQCSKGAASSCQHRASSTSRSWSIFSLTHLSSITAPAGSCRWIARRLPTALPSHSTCLKESLNTGVMPMASNRIYLTTASYGSPTTLSVKTQANGRDENKTAVDQR